MAPPFKLSLQNRSFPAHNGNSSPCSSSSQTVDWLPDYRGYSWLAYGSFSSLVISLAPVPTRKAEEMDLEVCHIIDSLHETSFTCVLWDPSCSGIIASTTGNHVCIYGPEFPGSAPESQFSVFPRAWLLKYKLEHAFHVYNFAWTESGDGLLVVGAEVVMWMRNEEGWYKLWRSDVDHPQFSAAATFSAKGLAATTGGGFMNLNDPQEHACKSAAKGVTVWWWEDSVGLLEAELIHPQEVVMIQWRPSKTDALQKPFRSVLLTTCKDGAVRLWIEMDNGKSRLDKAIGKDMPLKHLKPSFFVGAVIEAEQCLYGNLGKDVFVSWPSECIAPRKSDSWPERNSVVNTVAKRENIVSCEWLIGLGPEGSICIWGVLYIDDINPSRCPRIFLWKKSSAMLTASQPPVGLPVSRMLMKVVAQRLGRNWGDPPSCLDLFYTADPLSFHWFRIWLPVSSISGNDCRDSVVSNLTAMPGSNTKDAWGVVSEQLHTDSHSHNVTSLAVHPITHVGLIATLDSHGHIFLWKIPAFSYLTNMDSVTCFSRWKPLGHFIAPSNSRRVTWLPALFLKDQAILLLVHAGSIDCYVVLENSTTVGFSLLLNLLYRIDMFVEQDLWDIWAIPTQNLQRSATETMNFTIVGQGQTSSEVICCDLGITTKGADYYTSNADAKDEVKNENNNLVVRLFGLTNLKQPEHVSCLAAVPSAFLPFREASTNCLMFESMALGCPYNLATGSDDGTVRLWKRGVQELSIRKLEIEDNYWVCIGVLKARLGPVTMMSVGNFGLKIATGGPIIHGHEIEIWNLESYVDIAYFNLSFKIRLESCPISVQWMEAGNGQSMLGMLTETEVKVYSETKIKEAYTVTGKVREIPWFHLASVRLFSSSPCFSWGPKGSLLVPIRDHILIYGPKLILEEDKMDSYPEESMIGHYNAQLMGLWRESWSLFKAGKVLYFSLPLYHPTPLLYLLYSGNHQQARVCLSYLLQNLPKLTRSIAKENPCDSCQMFFPMHLKAFFQGEAERTGKFSTKEHGNKLNWGNVLNDELEYEVPDFSRLGHSNEASGASAHHMDEVSSIENLEARLHSLYLYGLNENEKNDLLTVANVLHKLDAVSKATEYQSLDLPGKRFWVSVQLSHSKQCRKYGRNARVEELTLDSKTMAWALQSECKESLVDICLGDELTWPSMRALGIGFWLTDAGQLRARIEKLARVQYLSGKDPKSCALLYLALQRKNVLTSLFKLSRDEKDKVLYEFLTRDFQEDRNQAAALKNAYVLMGKHRHDLAAAFFLLGGDLSSAVSVCAKNLGDLQLALVICRLVEGINGETEGRLLRNYALPNAHSTGDCWLACSFQWLLGEKFQALEELVGKLNVSDVSGFLDIQGKERTFSLVSQDRTGLSMPDPDVWHFCHLLATNRTMESSLNSSSVMALRRWIMCKISIALEKLGLPLQALEHMNSVPLPNETTVGYSQSPSLKQLLLDNIQDELPVELEDLKSNIIFLGVEIFESMKVNLALQYQAQLVQAHPGWKFNGLIECNAVSDSDKDKMSIPNASSSHSLLVQANKKLVQSLHIFTKRYSINEAYLVAELAKFVYNENNLYLQSIFMKDILNGADIGNQLIMKKSSFLILNDLLQKSSRDLLKVITYVGLICCSDITSSSSLLHKTDITWDSSVNLAEIMHLASSIRLLCMDNEGKGKAELEVTVLLILCSICSWQLCDWSAVEGLTKLIKSRKPAHSMMAVEIDALLKVTIRTYCSNFILNKKVGWECYVSDRLMDLEKRHVLALAFWDAFLVWAKRQSGYKVNKSFPENTIMNLDRTLSGIDTFSEQYVRAVASMSHFFLRKLVLYMNSSDSVDSGYLHSWLWGNHTSTGGNDPQETSEHNLSMMKNEGVPEDHGFVSVSDSVNTIWKELVVHNHIKSALELCGVKPYSSPRSNAKENTSTSITRREGVHESGLHGKAVDVGVISDHRTLGHSAYSLKSKMGEEVLYSGGDLFEAFCVNSCCPEQIVVASSKKGLIFLDLNTRKSFSTTENSLWGQVEWPQNGWAKSESTPLPTFVSPGVGLASKEGRSLGLGGSAVGLGVLTAAGTESSFKGAGVGIPGYGGVGALGMGWDDWEDFDGVVDPLATLENVSTQAMDSHPLRPLFLVGSRNTHVYLWEFGKSSATATYGILPAANISPPYAVASVSAVRFDHSGHRFASSAIDGTVCTWQLEVGGRSNVRPTESYQCFTRHASDVAFLGASGAIIAATGASENDLNLVFWDTLAPSTTSRASVFCHEGGARCLEMFDHHVGGGSFSPLIVTCGKSGDIALHDFRYIATGKARRQTIPHGVLSSKKQHDGELKFNGMVWYLSKAHSGSITCVSAVPGTSLFLTGSKDGDVKLWDANKCELVDHYPKVHERHMFLQHNARGFGAVVQAAVTDMHPVSSGFVTSGGDGSLKFFRNQFA